MVVVLQILLRRVTRNQALGLAALGVGCVLAGALAFAATQRVPLGTALYWAVTTATTVGYGDVTPHNGAGRVIAVAMMLTAIPLFGSVFAVFAGIVASVRVTRLLTMAHPFPDPPYALLCGTHPTVPTILDELARAHLAVVLVSEATADPPAGVHVVRGDPTEEAVLRRARPERATQALVVGADDGRVLVTTVVLRHLAPQLPVSVLVQSRRVADAIRDLGVSRILSSEDLIAHTMAKSLEAPHAADLLSRLLDAETHRLCEIAVEPAQAGRRLSELRPRPAEVILALVHGDRVDLGVGADPTVAAGDRLLVLRPAEPGPGAGRP